MPSSLVFPPFRLDLETGILWQHDQPRQLRPQVVALLHYLFSRAGTLVTKEEILTALWPGTTVSNGVLKTYIWEIRHALGEKQKTPQFIETIPRRGYRFVAPLHSTQPVRSPEQFGVESQQKFSPRTPNSELRNLLLVGRESELTSLQESLAKALSGERQIVCITGDAGIGKTALTDTFLRQARETPQLWIAHGQCIEHYGAGEAYLPLLEAFGRLGREAGKKRLLNALRQYAPSWLVQLPGLLPFEERALVERSLHNVTQERMLREIIDALEVITSTQPLLLVLEDLHWSDPSTLELMSALARWREPARLLVLLTYRPADVRSHSLLQNVAEEVQKRECGRIVTLAPLNEETVGQYLAQRLREGLVQPPSLTALTQAIHQRTAGNPLFMRQTTDYLLTQATISQTSTPWSQDEAVAIVEETIPHNIQHLIEQQLARLHPEERYLLEAASVVGSDFSTATVAITLGQKVDQIEQWCDALARRHLFLQFSGGTPRRERRQAARYRFIHSLYSQVLYDGLTPTRRRQLHQVIGTTLVSMYGERTREFAGALANHFAEAHEPAQAVTFYEQAAHKALQLSAPQEAVAHFVKSLEQLAHLPVSAARDQQELGLLFMLAAPLIATKGYTAPESEAVFSRVRDLCRQTGDTYRLFIALLGVWGSLLVRGQILQARQTAEELLAISHTLSDQGLQLSAHMAVGMPLFYEPQLTAAHTHLTGGLALYDRHQHAFLASIYGQDPGVTMYAYSAWVAWLLGYPDQANQKAAEARALAETLAHPYSQAFALMFGAWLHVLRREPVSAQEWATAAMQHATEYGFPYLVTAAKMSYGWARVHQGDAEEGIAYMREALERHREKGEELGRPYDLALLAHAYHQQGEKSTALALLDDALTVIERTNERVYEAEIHRLYGELVLQLSERESETAGDEILPASSSPRLAPLSSPEQCFLNAIAIARQQQAKSLELRAVISLVRLRQHLATHAPQPSARRRLAEAHQMLIEVYDWFSEGLDTVDLQEAKRLLSTLSYGDLSPCYTNNAP